MKRKATGVIGALVWMAAMLTAGPGYAQDSDRFLGREDIRLLGAGLRVTPPFQTVPKDIASIVSTFLQAPNQPGSTVQPFAPDAVVKGILRGPGFARPVEISTRPNTPFNLPPFSTPGRYTLDTIRLESGGEVLLYGTPESVTIDVIEKLLVTQVTARPLTAQEIRDAGIVFDRSSFQAYNFTAAFAIGSANPVPISFPVVLPRLDAPSEGTPGAQLPVLDAPKLPRLDTIIPDTLKIQTQIPNLSVVGFTLNVPELVSKSLALPPIPGVIVIPGDIGFLNQFFNVTLLVGNVAPEGSNLVVSELEAEILLPAGRDRVPLSEDDPLRMARTATGESARVRLVVQAGPDGRLGTGDDIASLAPGETGSAEYLVEGRREGTHVIEMQMTGTLTGLPVGPVTVTGRAAGTVLVRNPTFTLTFTHPDLVNAGEPYTLDVTVTNTSESPANFVSLNLHPSNIRGAALVGLPSRDIETIPPGDSATVSFDLVAHLTGPVVAATLDSDDGVNGRFMLKTSVGELGVALSPDSLVLPKEAGSLPASLRAAALGLLGKAWAVATAPAAALPAGVSRFSKQIVYDRAIELAGAGFRYTLGEPLADALYHLALDFAGGNFTRIPERATSSADRALREADARGFDDLRRQSLRGDVLAAEIGRVLGESVQTVGPAAFHLTQAQNTTWRPSQISIVIAGDGGPPPYEPVAIDGLGRRLGGRSSSGKVVKEIPFGDLIPLTGGDGSVVGDLVVLASPDPGELVVRLTPRSGVSASTYTVSVVLPDGQGGLRQAMFSALGPNQVPGPVGDGPFRVRFELQGGAAVAPSSDLAVADPPPTVLGIMQPTHADLVGCEAAAITTGRVVAVLFSEEVTRESVQDGLTRGLITAFAPEANEAVGVAWQPGGRVVMVALRDPFGPLVARTMTVSGASDRAGTVMSPVTLPMAATIDDAAGIVFGRVLNADGTSAPGVEVRLFTDVGGCPGAAGVSSKSTDDEGRFTWDYVRMGSSRIVAVDPRTGDSRAVNFELQRNGQRLEVNVVFLGRGSLTGRTIDEDGTPLPRTVVRVTSLTDRSQHGATSGDDGRFSVTGVPVGNVIVEAVNTEVRAELTVSEFLPAAGAVIVRDLRLIRDDRRPAEVTFGSAEGLVLRGDGITPAGGVTVVAYYKNHSQPAVPCPEVKDECAVAVATSTSSGAFKFDRLVSGQFRLESFDQVSYQQGEARLIVPANGTAAANIILGLGLGTVRGVVLDSAGQRVAGARVGGGLSLTTADTNGQFTLADVPVGRREIVAVSDTLGTRGSTVVDLLRAGEEVNATIVLDAVAGISGLVTRADGSPARRARVYVFYPINDGIRVVASTDADDNGRYSIGGLLLRERYHVSSFLPSFLEGNVVTLSLKFANEVARADIRYRGQGKVQGVVLGAPENGADGTPLAAAVGLSGDQLEIAGGQVGVRFVHVTNFAVTDTNFTTGRFAFGNAWVGGFTLRAVGAFSPVPIAVEGRVEQPGQVVEMRLQLQATSVVTGRVVLPDGVTPAGPNLHVVLQAKLACIQLFDACVPQGVQRYDAVTDADGRFEFPAVGARRFTLTATDPAGGRLGVLDGDVAAGETADFDLRLLALPTFRVRVFRSDAATRVANALVELTQEIPREDGEPLFKRVAIADGNGETEFVGSNAPVEGELTVLATDRDGTGFSGRATGRIRREDDGRTVTLDVYLFDQSGVVVGTVFKSDGLTPVPNAEVAVSNEQGALAFAVTDANGVFRVETIPLGPVFVDAFEAATGRRGFAQSSIDLNGREIVVNIRQFGVGTVTGQLLQTGFLAPLKGWSVSMVTTLPSQRTVALLTTSDVDGRFIFPGVSAGTFRLTATKRNVPVGGTVNGRLDNEGQVLDLPIVIDIPRQEFGRVEGIVFAPGGSPSGNAQVALAGPGIAPGTVTTADSQGRFSFESVPLGRFVVEASTQLPPVQRAAANVELLFENDVARASLVLGGTATITGTVFKADGVTPASFAQVFLQGQPFAGCETLQPISCSPRPDGSPDTKCELRASRGGCLNAADVSGRFTFSSISARTFTVVAEAVSGEVGQVGGPANPGETLDLRVVLSPSTSVRGRVLTADGRALASAVAEMRVPPTASGQPDRVFVATGPDGRFEFEAIRPGGPFPLTVTDPLSDGTATRNVFVASEPVDLGDVVLDEDAPTLTTVPAPLSVGVPLDAQFRLVFSEPVNPATVTASNVILSGPAAPLTLIITMEPGDASALVRPLGGLGESTRYTLLVKEVADRFGKVMPAAFSTTFTAADLTAPSIVQLTPAPNASGVPVTSTIRVQYNEPIDPARFGSAPIVLARGPQVLAGRTDFALGNTVVVFTPTFPLLDDTSYDLRILAASDASGNVQPAPVVATFSTTDRTAPVVTSLTVGNGGRAIENTVVDVVAETSAANDVAFVDFYVRNVLAFTDRQAPFVFPFLAAASHGEPGTQVPVTALATDTSGNRGTTPAAASVEIVADAAPAVTITAPADGFAGGNNERITLAVSASDDVGVTHVGFRADTGRPQDAATIALPSPVPTTTQSFAFNMPANAAPGSRVHVVASVRDTRGQTNASTISLVVLDAVAPTVTITGAASGARVAPGEQANVIVLAADPGAVRSVTFQASGAAATSQTRAIDPALNVVAVSFALAVPAAAQPGQTISLTATATDAAGNVGTAATLALSVADRNAPTLTLHTVSGQNDMVPGAAARIVATAEDEVGVARISIRGDGAFSFTDARSFSPALGSASTEFVVNVPPTVVEGQVLSITASAVDIFGNTSDPVTLVLQARSIADVTAPSTIVIAGESADVPITLSTPAPAGGLTLTFVSRAPAVVTSAASVTVPAGQTSGLLRVNGLAGGITQIDILSQGVPRGSFTVTVRGGIVSGRIFNANGPVAGASVSVEVGPDIRSTMSDGEGRYFFEGLTGGAEARVNAVDPSGQLIGFSRGLMNAIGGWVRLDVLLIEAGRISGLVTRADGSPLGAGVQVEIFDAKTAESLAIEFTDEDGRYEFPLVTLGAYQVDAFDTSGNRGRTAVSLTTGGQEAEADIRFLGRGTVTGTVRSNGSPVPNIPVTLRGISIFGAAPVVTTNAGPDGVYRIEGVFVGSFSVTAFDPVTDLAGFETGTVAAHGQVVTRDLTLQNYGTLEGRVLRADGNTPVPGARVRLTSRNIETVADVDGVFRFQFLPLGTYTIDAFDVATEQPAVFPADRDASMATGRATATLTTPRVTVERDVLLLPVATIVATVVDSNGQLVPGATVLVSSTNGPIVQRRQGTTNGDGVAVIDHVITGSYNARALTLQLASDPKTGAVPAGGVVEITLTLAPTGSVAGLLAEPDGATPVAGGFVSFAPLIGDQSIPVNTDGTWRFDGLRFGTYTLYGFDAERRLRAVVRNIVIDEPNEVETRTVALAGIGTVSGRLVNPDGSGVPNAAVVLQSFSTVFPGGTQRMTNAAGFYEIPDVLAGSFRVSFVDMERQLAAEAFGSIAGGGGDVTIDLALVPNSIQLPTFLYDANGTLYQIERGIGDSANFGISLDVTVGSTTARFEGNQLGTREDGGREIAARQTIGSLQVTRKIFVPRAYLARSLEQFTNLGDTPVTVNVLLTTRKTQGSGSTGARVTSSGDAVFSAAQPTPDRWLVIRQGAEGDPIAGTNGNTRAWVLDGAGAPLSASVLSASAPSSGSSTIQFGWTITVPPGGTTTLMHFTAQMHSQAAGVASAERLSQLPPEALEGLSPAEVASIVNFAVPAGAVSAVEPLPRLDGTARGRVLEGDGVTPMPRDVLLVGDDPRVVRFRSSVIFYGRVQLAPISNTVGEFTLAANLIDSSSAVVVPVAPFTVDVRHTWSRVISPPASGAFPENETTGTVDVIFANTGMVAGTVRHATSTPVTTPNARITAVRTTPATPTLQIPQIPVGADGSYRVFGVPGVAFTLTASAPHAQGSPNTGVALLTTALGTTTNLDITLAGTGTITGFLSNALGQLVVGGQVRITQGTFTRLTSTDTAGQFTFGEVPAGQYTVSAQDPATGRESSAVVNVGIGQTVQQDLSYIATGGVTGVLRTNAGQPVGSVLVTLYQGTLQSQTFTRSTTTNGAGAYSFTNLLPGSYTLTAVDPVSSIRVSAPVTVLANQTVTQDLTFAAVGTVTGQLRRADNSPVPNALVQLIQGSVTSPTFSRSATTNGSGQFTFAGIGPGVYTLTSVDASSGARASVDVTVVGNQTTTQNLVYPATGSIEVTVTLSSGTPLAGAAIVSRLGTSGSFTFRGVTDAAGRFTIADQAPGTHQVRAQHPQNFQNQSTVSVTVATGAAASVALSLLPAATLDVSVRTFADEPVPDAQIDINYGNGQNISFRVGFSGDASFEGIFGNYTATAWWPDTGEPNVTVSGTVTAEGATIPVLLKFPPMVTLSGRVTRVGGGSIEEAGVTVEGGSSRRFAEVEPDGQYSVQVPAGATYTVTALEHQFLEAGIEEITLAPTATSATLDILLDDAYLPATLQDGGGRSVTIGQSGEVLEFAPGNEGEPAQRFLMSVQAGEEGGGAIEVPAARFDLDRQQLTLVDQIGESGMLLYQQRRVYVPQTGDFVRFLDVFENRGTTPITFSAVLNALASTQSTGLLALSATSSGDLAFTPADHWVVADSGTRRFSHIVSGQGGRAPDQVTFVFGFMFERWNSITLQPGQRIAFLTFGTEHADAATARAAAERVVLLPPDTLVGLTPQERAIIVNFVVPQ